MLSPVINTTKELLTQSFKEIMQLDKYAISNNNIMIGTLPINPPWLTAAKNHIQSLSHEGSAWMLKKPDLWSSILVQFPDYTTAMQSIADMQKQGSITDKQWLPLLKDVLYPQLVQAVDATQKASLAIQAEYDKFKRCESGDFRPRPLSWPWSGTWLKFFSEKRS